VKIVVAAVQMPCELSQRAANLEVADDFLSESHQAGAQLSVLPEMFNTGYGLLPDFGPGSERADGPTLRHLSCRSRQWWMGIAAGFVERDGRHIYDSLALCLPAGSIHFANQTGMTRTTIPVLGLTLAIHIADRFAGHSSICGGRRDSPTIAGLDPQVLLSEVSVSEHRDMIA
jgi:Carbon-nitrogen hydrolase